MSRSRVSTDAIVGELKSESSASWTRTLMLHRSAAHGTEYVLFITSITAHSGLQTHPFNKSRRMQLRLATLLWRRGSEGAQLTMMKRISLGCDLLLPLGARSADVAVPKHCPDKF